LDEDWIAHFFDKCENVSNKEMQTLWSRLLAVEATTSGTYSKRTIDLVVKPVLKVHHFILISRSKTAPLFKPRLLNLLAEFLPSSFASTDNYLLG
jgi:hypothetical protein